MRYTARALFRGRVHGARTVDFTINRTPALQDTDALEPPLPLG